jgi:hypothetical protein
MISIDTGGMSYLKGVINVIKETYDIRKKNMATIYKDLLPIPINEYLSLTDTIAEKYFQFVVDNAYYILNDTLSKLMNKIYELINPAGDLVSLKPENIILNNYMLSPFPLKANSVDPRYFNLFVVVDTNTNKVIWELPMPEPYQTSSQIFYANTGMVARKEYFLNNFQTRVTGDSVIFSNKAQVILPIVNSEKQILKELIRKKLTIDQKLMLENKLPDVSFETIVNIIPSIIDYVPSVSEIKPEKKVNELIPFLVATGSLFLI